MIQIKKIIILIIIQGLVTQDTLGILIPFVTKKRKKKNYQEIIMEYLNYLGESQNKNKFNFKRNEIKFFFKYDR